MRWHITRALHPSLVAGVGPAALSSAGAGTTGSAIAAEESMGPLACNSSLGGYQAGGGRWSRFLSATLTVPARGVPAGNGGNGGNAYFALTAQNGTLAYMKVMTRGAYTVSWEKGQGARLAGLEVARTSS